MGLFEKLASLFLERVERTVKKFAFLDQEQQQIVTTHLTNLMLNPFASLKNTCKEMGVTKNSKKLSRIIERIHKNKEIIEMGLQMRSSKYLDRRKPVIVAIDDFVQPKSGQKIARAGTIYDHAKREHTHGFSVVDAACIQDHLPLASTFEVQVLTADNGKTTTKTESRNNSPYTTKIEIAAVLVVKMLSLLQSWKMRQDRIWVLADRWYPCKAFVTFVRQQKVNYLLAVKKNATVLLPDRKAMRSPQQPRRGRPR